MFLPGVFSESLQLINNEVPQSILNKPKQDYRISGQTKKIVLYILLIYYFIFSKQFCKSSIFPWKSFHGFWNPLTCLRPIAPDNIPVRLRQAAGAKDTCWHLHTSRTCKIRLGGRPSAPHVSAFCCTEHSQILILAQNLETPLCYSESKAPTVIV